MSGLVAGLDTINYTIPTGCISRAVVTVNPLPAAILVGGYVCIGITTPLSDPDAGGTWSISNTALATVSTVAGTISGVAAGSPVITYTLPTGCITTSVVTVNTVAPTISGPSQVCQGLSISLTDTLPGGTWSSSDLSIATVGVYSGAVVGISAGSISLSYAHSGFVCPAMVTVTVNPLPAPISGVSNVCVASVVTLSDAGGGTWSSGSPFIATIDSVSGIVTGGYAGVATIAYTLPVTGCKITMQETVNPLPSIILGSENACLGYTTVLTDPTAGGTWSSVNTAVASIDPTGVVYGIDTGTTVISYTIATGCATTLTVDVISVPAISGVANICGYGDTLHLADAMAGGAWSSTLVTVSSTGDVIAYAAGVATITYTIPAGCYAAATLTVNSLPGPITGIDRVCVGLSTALSDAAPGGSWTSSNTSVASINSLGLLTAATVGTSAVTYTLPTGCTAATTVTVSPLPTPIGGVSDVCIAATVPLFDGVPGGSWTSSNTAIANVIPSTGMVTGVTVGLADITYSFGVGCTVTRNISVMPLPEYYSITGGGNYCSGGAGVHVGLSGSDTGISYQLYDGTFPIGTPVAGTGGPIDFGLQTLPGSYTVEAINATTDCSRSMLSTAIVVVNSLPDTYIVTGGGNYCAGGAGIHVGVNGSATGINYELFYGTTLLSTLPGSGSVLDFGAEMGAGTYTVIAVNPATSCSARMLDSATIIAAPLLIPSVSISPTATDTICSGNTTTFFATAVNGGTTPSYQWKVNGGVVGTSAGTYSYTPVNGDQVSVRLTSTASCASPDTAVITEVVSVKTPVAPVVSIIANPGLSIATGQSVTFTASVANGGAAPAYQWEINAHVVSGATQATFTYSTFNNGDIVSCVVTSSGYCPDQGASAGSIVIVNANVAVAQIRTSEDGITLSPNPNKGDFTIAGSFPGTDAVSVELTNLLGQSICKDAVVPANGQINKHILIPNAVNGMYILSLRSGDVVKIFHVVIEQ